MCRLLSSLLLMTPFTALADIILPPSPSPRLPHSRAMPYEAQGDVLSIVPGPVRVDSPFPLFLVCLGLTLLIESAIVYFFARRVFRINSPRSRLLLTGLLPSFITLTLVYTFNISAVASSGMTGLVALEVAIALLETVIIKSLLPLRWNQSFIISFAANLISFLCGLIGLPTLLV